MAKILLKDILIEGRQADLMSSDDRIAWIRDHETSSCCECDDCEVLECSGKAALPGFVNMHTHSGMALMKGIGEDIAFHEWLDRIWKIESAIDEEYVYHATKVACLEMIKTGTTTFNDHYWHMPMARKAAIDALNGWDPSYGCLYYYNPKIATSGWIFSRPTVVTIGNHVFAI